MSASRFGFRVCLLLVSAVAVNMEAQSPDFEFGIGGSSEITGSGETASVTVSAPGRVVVPLVIKALNEFRGTVVISKGTTDIGTNVVSHDCPPEGGMHCFFETLPLEVTADEAFATVLVSPSPTAKNGQVIFTARAGGIEKRAVLDVQIALPPERTPAASVTVEPDAFELSPGEEKRVLVSVQGEQEWNGGVDVTAKGSNGTTVSEEMFTIDTPGSHEITVRALPNAGPNHYAYVRIKVFPRGKTSLISETVVKSEVKGTPAEFTVSADPAQLELSPGGTGSYVTVSIDRSRTWGGDIDLRIEGNDKVDVSPSQVRLNGGQAFQQLTITAKHDAAPTEGSEKALVVTASPVGGGSAKEAFIGLLIRADESPIGFSPQLEEFVRSAVADNSHVEDLASALSMGPAIRDDRADEQKALASVYDALISDLRNPSAMASRLFGQEPEQLEAIDLAVVERIIEESGVLRRDDELRRRVYEVASITGSLPLFSVVLDGGDSVPSGLSSVRAGQKVNWSECRTPIEVVVQQMRLARSAKKTSDWLGFTDAVLKSIEARWDVTNTDLSPWPQMQAALKIEALVGSAIGIADTVGKVVVAFMPNEITDFYTVVGDKRYRKGETPQIEKGTQVNIRAEIVTGSPGGEIKSPMEIALMVCERVLKMKKISDKIEKLPSERQKAAAEEIKKVAEEIVRRVNASVAAVGQHPAIKAWADSPQGFWKIPPFKNPPVVINTSTVLNLGSRSPMPLQVVEVGDGTYALRGVNAAKQAGYYFGLKKDLLLDLSPLSTKPLVETAVVDIVAEEEPDRPGQRCTWTDTTWVRDPAGVCLVIKKECVCVN